MKLDEVAVLYIITKLELGGAQKVCLSLLNGVNKSGIKAGLISGADGSMASRVKKSEYIYLLDSIKREVGFRFIISEIKAFFQIIKIIKKIKKIHPSLIVHTHSTKAGIIGRWAAFFSGVKKRIHTVHGFGFNDYQSKVKWFFIFSIEYLTSLITTHFICVSEKDREFGVRKFPKFGQKSSIIRAAVEWDKFYTPALKKHEVSLEQNISFQCDSNQNESYHDKSCPDKSCRDKSFVIGTISCFKPQKNLFDLLNAFKILHSKLSEENKKIVRLQIIGDGVLRYQIEEWISKNNLSEKIDLLGWQNNVEVWMRGWKVFAMSSLWEGLPIAVVEARLCKLPVVTYDVGGIFEVIFNGQNGFLVSPKNFDKLSDCLRLLIENKELWQKMSDFNDEISDFSDHVMIDKHVQLYQKILQ
ncbi:MAG: glycosyltransferase [bacterium]